MSKIEVISANVAGSTITARATGVVTIQVPTRLVIIWQPASVLVNSPFLFMVSVLDAFGAIIPSYTGAVTVTHTAGVGSLGGTTSVACVGGIATFADLTLDTTGAGNVLHVASGSLTALIPVDSVSFNVGNPPKVIYSGDSITAGSLSSNPATKAYPVIAQGGISYATFHNSGLPSQTLGPRSGATSLLVAAPTADYTFIDAAKTNFSVLMIGVNDLTSGTDNMATALYADIQTWITQTKAAGVLRCSIITILPFAAGASSQETQRLAFIDLLLNNAVNDGAFAVVNMGLNPHFANGYGSSSPSYNDTTYYNSDQLHLTDTGYAEVGNFIRPAVIDMIANVKHPAIALTSTSGSFTNNAGTSSSHTTVIQNTGTGTMNWTATPDDASVTALPASGSLAPGRSATVTITAAATGTAATPGIHTLHTVFAGVDPATGRTATGGPISYVVNETTNAVIAFDAFNRASLNASRVAPDVSPPWTITGITVVISAPDVSFSADTHSYGAVYIDAGSPVQTASFTYSALGTGVAVLCLRMVDETHYIGIYANAGTLHAAIFDATGPITSLGAGYSYTPSVGDKLKASADNTNTITVSYVRSGTTTVLGTFDATPYASNTATNVGFSLDASAVNKINFFGATLP